MEASDLGITTGDGTIFNVINPDGIRTTLTCTQEQLEQIWIPDGYVVVEDDNNGDIGDGAGESTIIDSETSD